MNYNINLQMHVASHVTVVKVAYMTCSRVPARRYTVLYTAKHIICYTYDMTQRRRVSFNFCV